MTPPEAWPSRGRLPSAAFGIAEDAPVDAVLERGAVGGQPRLEGERAGTDVPRRAGIGCIGRRRLTDEATIVDGVTAVEIAAIAVAAATVEGRRRPLPASRAPSPLWSAAAAAAVAAGAGAAGRGRQGQHARHKLPASRTAPARSFTPCRSAAVPSCACANSSGRSKSPVPWRFQDHSAAQRSGIAGFGRL